jgi:hypothetical protein
LSIRPRGRRSPLEERSARLLDHCLTPSHCQWVRLRKLSTHLGRTIYDIARQIASKEDLKMKAALAPPVNTACLQLADPMPDGSLSALVMTIPPPAALEPSGNKLAKMPLPRMAADLPKAALR